MRSLPSHRARGGPTTFTSRTPPATGAPPTRDRLLSPSACRQPSRPAPPLTGKHQHHGGFPNWSLTYGNCRNVRKPLSQSHVYAFTVTQTDLKWEGRVPAPPKAGSRRGDSRADCRARLGVSELALTPQLPRLTARALPRDCSGTGPRLSRTWTVLATRSPPGRLTQAWPFQPGPWLLLRLPLA